MKKTIAQCTLKSGNTETTAWLDVSRVKVGSIVTLKNYGTRRWRVDSISDIRLSADYVNDRSQDYKRTRKASDV